MTARSLLLAGTCTLALAAPAAAAPGQCFTAAREPIGPVYDTEQPNTDFITWVQARGGECRALRADEVTLYRGRPAEYPMEFRRSEIQEGPPGVAPGAPRMAPEVPLPPRETVVWQGDPAEARRLVVTYYQSSVPNLTVTDTGRVVTLAPGGTWRIYETIYPDGRRRQVAVQMRPNRQYVLMENARGERWSETIELEE
jgi:hypothetical protein